MDDGMNVSLGCVLSGEAQSVITAAKNDDLLIVTCTSSAKKCIDGNDKAFRVCFNDPAQGTASANYIADNNLGKKIAVFYQSDIDYSAGLYETFTQQAAARGLEIVAQQSFTEGTKTDFSTQINAIRNSGCDLVFIPIYAAEASVFLTQAKGKLDGMTIFGCDGLDGLQTKVSDTSMLKGTMMLTPFAVDAPDAKTQSFVEKFTKVHGSKPDQFAADAYDAVYAVKAAMESCGKTPADADFTTAMVDTMYKITVDGLTGTMKWDADREPDKAAKAMGLRPNQTAEQCLPPSEPGTAVLCRLINKSWKEGTFRYGQTHPDTHQRPEPRQYLCPDRSGLYHGVRHREDAELRPRRHHHGRRVCRYHGGLYDGTAAVYRYFNQYRPVCAARHRD